MKVRHPEKIKNTPSPIKKKPEWIRSKIVNSQLFFQTKQVVNKNNLVTVCPTFHGIKTYVNEDHLNNYDAK